eukprot:500615-Pyramimonas_sp.AAC.1
MTIPIRSRPQQAESMLRSGPKEIPARPKRGPLKALRLKVSSQSMAAFRNNLGSKHSEITTHPDRPQI